VADEADAGAMRRAVAGYAERPHVPPEGIDRAQFVGTELATNLRRHRAHRRDRDDATVVVVRDPGGRPDAGARESW
jgi:hypothetical protein